MLKTSLSNRIGGQPYEYSSGYYIDINRKTENLQTEESTLT